MQEPFNSLPPIPASQAPQFNSNPTSSAFQLPTQQGQGQLGKAINAGSTIAKMIALL